MTRPLAFAVASLLIGGWWNLLRGQVRTTYTYAPQYLVSAGGALHWIKCAGLTYPAPPTTAEAPLTRSGAHRGSGWYMLWVLLRSQTRVPPTPINEVTFIAEPVELATKHMYVTMVMITSIARTLLGTTLVNAAVFA